MRNFEKSIKTWKSYITIQIFFHLKSVMEILLIYSTLVASKISKNKLKKDIGDEVHFSPKDSFVDSSMSLKSLLLCNFHAVFACR